MVDADPSPHHRYDQYMARQRKWGSFLRRSGQIAFYVIAVVLTLVSAALLVMGLIDLAQPKLWGTFTETACEPRFKGGCRSVGYWISDDGSLVKSNVYLDGWPDDDGTTRASYQPNALLGDDIVHVAVLTGVGPWLTAAFLLGWIVYTIRKAASWGDIRLPSLHRRAGSDSGPPARQERSDSPRRRYRDAVRSAERRGGSDG